MLRGWDWSALCCHSDIIRRRMLLAEYRYSNWSLCSLFSCTVHKSIHISILRIKDRSKSLSPTITFASPQLWHNQTSRSISFQKRSDGLSIIFPWACKEAMMVPWSKTFTSTRRKRKRVREVQKRKLLTRRMIEWRERAAHSAAAHDPATMDNENRWTNLCGHEKCTYYRGILHSCTQKVEHLFGAPIDLGNPSNFDSLLEKYKRT